MAKKIIKISQKQLNNIVCESVKSILGSDMIKESAESFVYGDDPFYDFKGNFRPFRDGTYGYTREFIDQFFGGKPFDLSNFERKLFSERTVACDGYMSINLRNIPSERTNETYSFWIRNYLIEKESDMMTIWGARFVVEDGSSPIITEDSAFHKIKVWFDREHNMLEVDILDECSTLLKAVKFSVSEYIESHRDLMQIISGWFTTQSQSGNKSNTDRPVTELFSMLCGTFTTKDIDYGD